MKKWVIETFGDSLKFLTEKLDEVDKKSKLVEDEKEELKRLRAEKELLELKDDSSSEKRKRHPSTPSISPRMDRIHVKSSAKTKKAPTKRVFIPSDEDDDDGAELVRKGRGNLTRKFDEVKGKGKEKAAGDMTEIKDLLKQLVTNLGHTRMAANTGVSEKEKTGHKEKGECSTKNGDHDRCDHAEDRDELGLTGYMKNRVESYSSMYYTHIMALCKEQNIEYTRKGLSVMELTRLDVEEYMRCLREMEENGAKVAVPNESAVSNGRDQDIQGN
ncbi:hypothetical protein CBR_g34190 [Chara braunii]|uniref:Uncharacterized protein n=1 Tax=Chara braunii TaxID=69332 RepID=A0A388LI56_CHABU|nr:hypothetical protein CBR_g34190 [Chara braunii]|eukprot:GBG82010.1 hypothetical protein CBR_g34190 [Chara braunii]